MAVSIYTTDQTAETNVTASGTYGPSDPYCVVFEVERNECFARRCRGAKTGTVSPVPRGGSRRKRSSSFYAAPVTSRAFHRRILK